MGLKELFPFLFLDSLNKINALKKDNDSLREEIAELRKEINKLKDKKGKSSKVKKSISPN
jgi:cell division protein FtsB